MVNGHGNGKKHDYATSNLVYTPVWLLQIAMSVGTILLAIAIWDHLFRLLAFRKHSFSGGDRMTKFYAIIFFYLSCFCFRELRLGWISFDGCGLEVWNYSSRPAGDAMITTIWTGASGWTLTALPLFIWMGKILFRTRLSEDMFKRAIRG